MKMKTTLVANAVFFSLVVAISAKDYLRVCYYSNWSQYRPGIGKFMPSDIDPDLCTHLIYSFAKLNPAYELTTFEWNDKALYDQFNKLKQGRNVKTLIAVGGWNAGSLPFSTMVTNPALRAKFVSTSVQYVKENNFDGLDLDWEYPAQRGGAPTDKGNFVKLMQELRAAFDAEDPPLLLTAAVPAGQDNIDAGYDVPELDRNLDFINLMSYDLHGGWESFTGFNSPLYGRTGETGGQEKLNMEWAAEYWVSKGASREKLIIGLATYGRTFTLSDASSFKIGAPARGAGSQGSWTGEAGFLSYYEICLKIDSDTIQAKWEKEHRNPYYVSGDQWIGYDNIRSIREKVEWLKSSNFGGAMIWNIDLDDFNQVCSSSKKPYPLLNTINTVLAADTPTPVTTTKVPTTTLSTAPFTGSTTKAPTDPPKPPSNDDYLRVCYYSNWSQYRNGIGKFMPSDIDPDLCTHLIYSFAKLNAQYELTTYEWNDKTLYGQFNKLKQGRNLKTLIAIGGWTAGSIPYSTMVTDPALRAKFVRTSVQYVKDNNFDGLDLDWEYPARRGGAATDKVNFVKLLKELRAAFDAEDPPLLLTAAVPAGQSNIDPGYDIPELDRNLDFINLMSYDLHGAWESFTGFHSPLYGRTGETGGQEKLNMEWAAKYWVSKGASRKKLIIGLATYGRTFTLSSSSNYYPGAPARGAGSQGSFTGEAGFMAYYEICLRISSGSIKPKWEPEHRNPYYVSGDQWIGYDDIRSIIEKVEWLMDSGFGGAMVWNIDLDDFNRDCPLSKQRYPLLNTINDVLAGDTPTTVSTTTISTTPYTGITTKAPTKPPPPPANKYFCKDKANGYYTDPLSCYMFYQCAAGNTWRKLCGPGLMWNQARQYCDWPYNVPCGGGTTTTTPKTTTTVYQGFCDGKEDGFYSDPLSCSKYIACVDECSYRKDCPGNLEWNMSDQMCDLPDSVDCTVTTTTTTPSTTTVVYDEFCVDKLDGLYADPTDCAMYYKCWTECTYHKSCPEGHYWDQGEQLCDSSELVDCNITSSTTTTPNPTTTKKPTTDKPTTSTKNPYPAYDENFCMGKSDGIHKNPGDCSGYYNCHASATHHYSCTPSGYLFDALLHTCREASLVNCADVTDDSGFCTGKYGVFPYPTDCQKYYHCGGSTTFVQTCNPPLLYDSEKKYCDRDPDCQGRPTPSCASPGPLAPGCADPQLTASSIWSPNTTPQQGRLNNPSASWGPATGNLNEYIQVDFLTRKIITEVITQGSASYNEWTKSYKVSTSADCVSFSAVEDSPGNDTVFLGNSDKTTEVNHTLTTPAVARCVRFYPQTYSGWPALRLEPLRRIISLVSI